MLQNPIDSVENALAPHPPNPHLPYSEDLIDLTGVDHDAPLVAPALDPPRRARATSPELLPDPEEDYEVAVLDVHPENDTLFTSTPALPPWNAEADGPEIDAPEPLIGEILPSPGLPSPLPEADAPEPPIWENPLPSEIPPPYHIFPRQTRLIV